jgi:colanic acid/amylovoran biosynthesis protein
VKYSVIASTFTGNLGGASMLEAAIQTISAKDSKAEFSVYSVYPKLDAKAHSYKNVKVYDARPLVLALWINPLALLYKILPPLRSLLKKSRLLRPIVEADVLLDQGGVTFVKGRTVFLIYNVATILPAMIVGTPVVKCSQALGDFSGKINKMMAKIFLPRTNKIFARGDMTRSYLDDLKLNNVETSADYAFLMEVSKENNDSVGKLFNSYVIERKGKTICIVPSKLVRKKVDRTGGDYVSLMIDFINKLVGEGYDVILLPHSTRFYTDKTHNNDVPVCREIAAGVKSYRFHFINQELNAQQVRAVIGRSDILITSRFHGMVSGLASGVPTLVVGWSHKYKEVMDQFGLAGHALSTKELTLERLESEFRGIFRDKKKIKRQIAERLPGVIKSAQIQVNYIVGVARKESKLIKR